MAIRYSAKHLLVAQISYTLVSKQRWFVFIPAALLTLVDLSSISNGIVFRVSESGEFSRGPLGLMPFIVAGIYGIILVWLLIRNSNKQGTEIVPICFLAFAFLSGIVMPFIFGKDYAKIFCTTICVALFVYYMFSLLQLTKKDPLTGLLNRQAYYADIENDPQDITAMVSLDMNGLKVLNDTQGHAAGDEALLALASAFTRASKRRQSVYRVGGDEFVIVCRRVPYHDTLRLVKRIRDNIAETKYSCSVGYSYSSDGTKPVDVLLKESDEMMYAEKARYYKAVKAQEEAVEAQASEV
jgi:diguanylate cyclase (GGDEF)-like protein